MNVVLLGCPGAGKGTQAQVLCAKYGLTHISTGELFRAEMAAKTPLGVKAASYVNQGNLVPDEVVVEMVAGKLETIEGGWLLDGFPRTLPQAEALDRYLKGAGRKIDFVVFLDVSDDAAVKRLSSRGREDDNETTVRKRLVVFKDLTQPLVSFYKANARFKEIDGAPSEAEVSALIVDYLDQEAAAKSGS
jgi:adenylate kinase